MDKSRFCFPHLTHRRSRSGFTLVEILTVIAITSVLAAILFPVTMQARRRSHLSVCTNNLRQMGASVLQYAADYDDALPFAPAPTTQWQARVGIGGHTPSEATYLRSLPSLIAVLAPYHATQPIFVCALDTMDPVFRESDPVFYKETWHEQVGSSYDYDDKSALVSRHLSEYPAPSQSPVMWDLGYVEPAPVTSRNVLFIDGHVTVLPHEKFWPLLAAVHGEP